MSEKLVGTNAPHPIRGRMRGFSNCHDRLWKITKPAEEYFPPYEAGMTDYNWKISGMTDYNWEITGFTRGLPDGILWRKRVLLGRGANQGWLCRRENRR
jgi:hypothetical protein